MSEEPFVTSAPYRVLVSTDLGGDPDDIQALVHLLHYSDILKIEGIVSSPGPGSINRVQNIREWIERTDLDHLRAQGHPALMAEAEVLAVTRQGATTPGHPAPGKGTDGSRLIVERAMALDPLDMDRPLWMLAWGALTDIAQALHDEPAIADKIRVHYIGSSNTLADPASRDYLYHTMKTRHARLWWIENGILPRCAHDTFRGVYLGGEQSGEWGNRAFVETNIREYGSTHKGKYAQKTGDVMPLSKPSGFEEGILKECDAPTFLYLLSPLLGGVGDVDDPTQESWGGQFRRPQPQLHPNYYVDLDAPPEVCRATTNKWRIPFLRSWKERWAWYAR